MHCNESKSGLLGFFRQLKRELFRNANPSIAGGKLSRDRHTQRRLMQIEPLETRTYLSGASFVPQVSDAWFQDVNASLPSYVNDAASNTYSWIVQFGNQDVNGLTAAQSVSLLNGGGINFQIVRGLGMVGEVLVQSSGATQQAVENWLTANTHVAAYGKNYLFQASATNPPDPYYREQWGMRKIDMPDAWDISSGSTGANQVVVAIIDTGVDYTHADIDANIWTGNDQYGNNVHGHDWVNNDNDPMDDNGHGTHIAGIIGAQAYNYGDYKAEESVVGVNWSVAMMPLKVLGSTGSGSGANLISAINYATSRRNAGVNVRVIDASLSSSINESSLVGMSAAIQAAGNAGILFVTAAGNNGINNDTTPIYPSSDSSTNVISVAATDQNDLLASYSNYGAASVDLAAPGVYILSTWPEPLVSGNNGSPVEYHSGTSMATAHVAGAAALAWATKPTATVSEVKNAILQSVDHVATLNGVVATGGRLNVYHTLTTLLAHPSTVGSYNPANATFSLKNYDNTTTTAPFGPAGWIPLSGDWNGDGIETNGVYNPASATFFLKNANDGNQYSYDVSVQFGQNYWTPVVGDWNGDGIDTVGVYNPASATFYMKNANSGGRDSFDISVQFGQNYWTPVIGDWNGDGIDTVGVYNPASAAFYMKNANSGGRDSFDISLLFGPANLGWIPISGDWDGNGTDTTGVYNPAGASYFLKNTHGDGQYSYDASMAFGSLNSKPLSGKWTRQMAALTAAGGEISNQSASQVTEADLQPLVRQAIASWAATGLSDSAVNLLKSVKVSIADLSGAYLGMAGNNSIYIDRDAAGYGWFIDLTPKLDEEFISDELTGQLHARDAADNRMDLLTALEHEFGHILGYVDLGPSSDGLMNGLLRTGVRYQPSAAASDAIFSQGHEWLI